MSVEPNWQPHLTGELLELRPLVTSDWEALFAAASDPLIWEQHPASDRYQEPVFREYFAGALASGGALAIIDRATGAIIGSSRYHDFDAEKSQVEVGWTFLARAYWGGKYNGELKQLMLDHAFRFAENVIFRIGTENWRSRKAVEKIGGQFVGTGSTTDANGQVTEHVIYQLARPA